MNYVEYVCEIIDTMEKVSDWHYVYGIIDALQFADKLSYEEVLTLRGEADKKLGVITAMEAIKNTEVDE